MNIYTTMAPTPSRVLGLYRLILDRGGCAQEGELAALFHPPPLRAKDTRYPEETLAAASELGLIESVPGTDPSSVRIQPAIEDAERDPDCLDETFPRTCARLALRPEINGEPNRFARLCAWFLAQPVGGIPVGHGAIKDAVLAVKTRQGWDFGLNTDNRLDMVVYWAKYLGLLSQLREGKCEGLVADPTDFLRRHLADLLPRADVVPVWTFRERLGRLCPVLDGGSVRDETLAAFDLSWSNDRLADSTAFALRRLADEKLVRLEYFNDARGGSFLRLGPELKVTGVARLSGTGVA